MNQQEIFFRQVMSKSPHDRMTFLSQTDRQARARDLMETGRVSGFVETAGAFFRQTNTVKNFATGLYDREFVPETGYNPVNDINLEENAWIKEMYPDAYIALLNSNSRAETAYKLDKIKKEHQDRQIIENAGAMTALGAGLAAGLTDPINYIALGGAMRAAKTVGLATRPFAVGAVGAAENAIGLSVAEPFLRAAQMTRTDEEFRRDLFGGMALGGAFGGLAGSMSAASTATTRALLGTDNPDSLISQQGISNYLQNNPDQAQRLDDLLDSDQGFAIYGETREELAGILLEATRETNPQLAQILGKDSFFGRMLVKFMFLNPAMNLSRSDSQFARAALDIMSKPAILRENTLDAQSVESVLGVAEVAAGRIGVRMGERVAEYRSNGGRLSEQEIFELAGKAAVRTDVVDPQNALNDFVIDEATGELVEVNPFAGLGQAEVDVVTEVAKLNRQFSDAMRKTAITSGAFTEQQIDAVFASNYLQRRYKGDKINMYPDQFRMSLIKAFEHKSATELPGLRAERDAVEQELQSINSRLQNMAPDDPARAATEYDQQQLQSQLREYNQDIDHLADPDKWESLAEAVELRLKNQIEDDSGGPVRTTNSLSERVLNIEDRFIAGFMDHNVQTLQQQQVRVLLPQVMAANAMGNHMDGFRLSPALQTRYTKAVNRLEEMNTDPSRFSFDEINEARLELEEILDDASHLELQSNLRVNLDVERLGHASQHDLQESLNSLVTSLKEARRGYRRTQSKMRELTARLEALRTANAGRSVIQDLENQINTLRAEAREFQNTMTQERTAINRYAEKAVVGGTNELNIDFNNNKFGLNEINFDGAVTPAQMLQRLVGANKSRVLARVANSRRQAFNVNNNSQQLKVQLQMDYQKMQREVDADTGLSFKKKQRQKEKLNNKLARDLKDLDIVFARIRRRDTPGDALGRGGKVVRDLNYSRLGGGFLISSLPDLLVGIGQVGLPNYLRAFAKRINPFLKDPQYRGDMADYLYANEAVLGGDRNRRIAGLDPLDPDRQTRIERFAEFAAEKTSKFLGLNRWNGMMKEVNAIAIQNKTMSIAKKIQQGKRLSRSDQAFMQGTGIGEDQLRRWAGYQDAFGQDRRTMLGGSFYHPQTGMWGTLPGIDENLVRQDRLAFERFIFQRTNQTIVTPGAADLPRWMTSTELGRLAGQFGSFSMAATSQATIPMLQKMAMGDMNQVLMFIGTASLGAASYWIRQALNGKDPFEDEVKRDRKGRVVARVPWWKKSVVEGIDRGGTLGWISQGNAILERMTGFGVSTMTGTGALTRMQARSRVDTILGPTAGFINDITGIAGAAVDKLIDGEPFSEGDYNAMRRMLPLQNLTQLRLGLDVAPSYQRMKENRLKYRSYQEAYLPAQQKLRNLLQGQ